MSIATTAERVGPYSVRYTWSGTAPYDVWVNGEKIADQTTDTEYVSESFGSAVPVAIEVTDADDVNPADSDRYSPRIRFQWRGQADAAFYLLQRYDGESWITKQIANETGKGYYTFTTVADADGDTPQWRVLSEDSRGYQSEVRSHSHTIVCNPTPPNVAFSYDEGTGLLTVSDNS